MSLPIFSVPLMPQLEYGDKYEMPVGAEIKTISLDPIDEAVQAVREAQDAVGKDIWEYE